MKCVWIWCQCGVELGKRLYFVFRQSRFIMFYLLEVLLCNIQHLQFEINLKQFNEIMGFLII